VIWSGIQFLIAGDTNGTVLTSFDGISWTGRTAAYGNAVNGAAWSGAQFAIVGTSSTAQTSSDGISWIAGQPFFFAIDGFPIGITLNGVAWFKNQFIAVGTLGAIAVF
jgi:hypothetical protein